LLHHKFSHRKQHSCCCGTFKTCTHKFFKRMPSTTIWHRVGVVPAIIIFSISFITVVCFQIVNIPRRRTNSHISIDTIRTWVPTPCLFSTCKICNRAVYNIRTRRRTNSSSDGSSIINTNKNVVIVMIYLTCSISASL
jgi:hypothetical protein